MVKEVLSRAFRVTNQVRYYARAAAMTGFYDDIKASSGKYKFYGNGEWMESTSGKGVSILNPTSNESVYEVQGEEQCSLLHKKLKYFP